jgi:ABC-2 type transport system permease protein
MTTTIDAPPRARLALMPQLAGLYAIWLREVKRAARDKGQLFGGVSRPLLWVIVMGIGLNPYFRGEIYGEVRVVPYTYLQFIFPAVIVLNIPYTSVQSAVSTIWDREFGFLLKSWSSPRRARATVLPSGKIPRRTTVAMFHGSLVLALARFADLTLTAADILQGLGLMFLLAFGLCSLGVVIANRVRSFEGFGVFSNAVILPLYFTSSSIFPPDPSPTAAQTKVVYPEWLVTIVHFNPLTYAVDSLRGAFIHFHQFDPKLGPIVLVVAALFFRSAARLPEGDAMPEASGSPRKRGPIVAGLSWWHDIGHIERHVGMGPRLCGDDTDNSTPCERRCASFPPGCAISSSTPSSSGCSPASTRCRPTRR